MNKTDKRQLLSSHSPLLRIIVLATLFISLCGNIKAQVDPCTCTLPSANLVSRGDFPLTPATACMTGYNSGVQDYSKKPCATYPSTGQITEGPNASTLDPSNWTGTTHTGTTSSSAFLIVNGLASAYAYNRAWYQSVSVTPGYTYRFQTWVLNIYSTSGGSPTKPSVNLAVKYGNTFLYLGSGALARIPYTGTWQLVCCTWTAPVGVTSVELDIIVPAGTGSTTGNDLGIDDISFQQVPDPSFTFPGPVCNNTAVQFTELPFGGSLTEKWTISGGGMTTKYFYTYNPTYTFTNPGTYTVTHDVTVSGCTFSSTKAVKVESCCICSVCAGQNLVYNGDFSLTCSPPSRDSYQSDLAVMGSYCNAPTSPERRAETDNANKYMYKYWCGMDHTSIVDPSMTGKSRFLVIDGPWQHTTDKRAWYQTITNTGTHTYIQGGKKYCFSAWLNSIDTFYAKDPVRCPSIVLQIKDLTPGNPPTIWTLNEADNIKGDNCCSWNRLSGCWPAPNGVTSIELEIIIKSGVADGLGNDVGIDDISFGLTDPCSTSSITNIKTANLCNKVQFASPSNDPNHCHSWNFGDGSPISNDPNPVHVYNSIGNWIVSDSIIRCDSSIYVAKVSTTVQTAIMCCGPICPGSSLVTNGDLSDPTPFTGYSTDFNPVSGGITGGGGGSSTSPGDIVETNDATNYNSPTWIGLDHTGNSSNFILVDGPTVSTSRVWYNTVSLTPGATYDFSAWVKNVCSTCNLTSSPTFELRIGGVSGTVIASSQPNYFDGWQLLCAQWTNSGNLTSVEIDITMQAGPAIGNDGAIDDIEFGTDCFISSPQNMGSSYRPTQQKKDQGAPNINPAQNVDLKNLITIENDKMNVYPIPIKQGESLNVSLKSSADGNSKIKITSVDGKAIKALSSAVKTGNNNIGIETRDLMPGTYLITIENNGNSKTQLFIVQ